MALEFQPFSAIDSHRDSSSQPAEIFLRGLHIYERGEMAAKNISAYGELLAEVKARGLLRKTPHFYLWSFAIVTLLSIAIWVAVISVGLVAPGWWKLTVIPLLLLQGALTAQYAFIAHELAHQQVFQRKKPNEWAGLVVANLFAGLSYGFWLQKHNRHHGKPNMVESDPDIDLRVIAFTSEQKFAKPSAERMLTRHQGWLFPVLIFFTSFDLLLDSFKSLFRTSGRGSHLRWLEGGLLLVRLLAPIAIYALVFPLWAAPAMWLAYMLFFGFFLGTSFAVNHIGMPLVEKGSRIGFLERQVLTSRNIAPSWWKNLLLGGLNAQIEHHLFPSMSRPNIFKVRPLVREFCRQRGIYYHEVSFRAGFGEVLRYLSRVGVSTRVDPFVCPLVAEFRQQALTAARV